MRIGRRAALALAISIAVGCLLAQQAEQPVVIKATTRLVMLSVIANRSNQPVADLTKDDFRVKVNGKVQPISVFSMESAHGAPSALQRASFGPSVTQQGTLPPDVFSNRLAVQSGTPSSVNVILLDTRNTRVADQIYAKAQIIRYLHTLQPTDHVGVYTFGGVLRVMHDYTSDSSVLIAKLNSEKNWELPDTSGTDAQGALQGDSEIYDDMMRGIAGGNPAERSFYTTDRVLATLHAFDFIAEHLAQLPGRKNLIWVSGGFPLDIGFDSIAEWKNPLVDQRTFTLEVDRTMRAMNDANISIYPVDARGLMTNPKFSAEMRKAPPVRPSLAPPIGVKEQQTMQEIAGRTGGLAFYNTNDLANAIHSAVEDSQVTYTIGFYPADDNFDGKFHKVDVETPSKSGVKLRYRKGYFDVAEKPDDDNSRQAELRDAVWSPIDATSLGIVANVKPGATDPSTMDISLKIDHSAIGLTQDRGRWQGQLDILFVQRNDQGQQFGGVDDKVNLDLTQATYSKLLSDDLAYHRVVAKAPQARLLRIVVRDVASGAMGSVTVPLNRVQ